MSKGGGRHHLVLTGIFWIPRFSLLRCVEVDILGMWNGSVDRESDGGQDVHTICVITLRLLQFDAATRCNQTSFFVVVFSKSFFLGFSAIYLRFLHESMSISCGRHWSRKRMWRRSFCIELHCRQFLCVDTTPAAPSSALHFIVVFCFYLLYHLSNQDFDTWPICVVEWRIFRTYIPGSVHSTPGTYVDLSSFSLFTGE